MMKLSTLSVGDQFRFEGELMVKTHNPIANATSLENGRSFNFDLNSPVQPVVKFADNFIEHYALIQVARMMRDCAWDCAMFTVGGKLPWGGYGPFWNPME